MAGLLRAMNDHLGVADRARNLMGQELDGSDGRVIEASTQDALLTAEAHGAFFRKLHGYGYCDVSRWEELAVYLPGIVAEAEIAEQASRWEHEMANVVLFAHGLRLTVGARRFLRAARPCMAFMQT